jgi:hypothetical protein
LTKARRGELNNRRQPRRRRTAPIRRRLRRRPCTTAEMAIDLLSSGPITLSLVNEKNPIH